MLSHLKKNYQNDKIAGNEPIVPAITTAFIDALSFPNGRHNDSFQYEENIQRVATKIKIVPIQPQSKIHDVRENRQNNYCHPPATVENDYDLSVSATVSRQVLIRNLIECLSHHYNNVLMGIWGNTTLIRMRTGSDTPLANHLQQMETLIENGSSLINMVLGYLGERREYGRRARLNQIVQELKEQDESGSYDIKPYIIKKRLQWAATVQHPQVIAGYAAKILNVLLQGLSARRSILIPYLPFDPLSQAKVDHIDALLLRGLRIMHYVQIYAEKSPSQMIPTLLKPVLSGVLNDVALPFSDTAYLLRRVPDRITCLMDRAILSEALRDIITFMVSQPSHYHGGGAYPNSIPVIEIEQNPDGKTKNIIISIRKANFLDEGSCDWRVFEPFRTDPRQNNANGLALAAASSTIIAHKGSLKERVESNDVKVFQIRIPILT